MYKAGTCRAVCSWMCLWLAITHICVLFMCSTVNGFSSLFSSICSNVPLKVSVLLFVRACKSMRAWVDFFVLFFQGWIQMPDFHLVFISHGQRLWCQPKQVMHLLTSLPALARLNELLLSWCQHFAQPVKETFLVAGCWARPSVVGHNLSRPERVLWSWAPGILQHVLMLLTHNASCDALFIMMHC